MSARPALLRPTQPTPDVNVDSGFGDVGGRIVRTSCSFSEDTSGLSGIFRRL
jgi:hypothetical protein